MHIARNPGVAYVILTCHELLTARNPDERDLLLTSKYV
jgi:hypothetical protein